MQLTSFRGHLGATLLTKTLRIMQLSTFMMFAFSLTLSAKTISQTVTFSGNNLPLEKVFTIIKKQTGYQVVYDKQSIRQAKPVSVTATQLPLSSFIGQALKDQPYTFSIEGNTVFIKSRTAAEASKPAGEAPDFLPPVPIKIRVVDAEGNPLSGASVINRNTRSSGATDGNGMINLNVSEGDVLSISFVGFESKQVKLTSNMTAVVVSSRSGGTGTDRQPNNTAGLINLVDGSLTISLKVSTSILDETQIIAYGTTSRRFNTGNVSTINATDIAKQPVNNPILALQGRIAGLEMTQRTGLPGTALSLRVQGRNGLLSGGDPFYVVDGVPYPQQLLSTGFSPGGTNGYPVAGSGGPGSPFSFLNPSDIESISVLKDADALAIYGSRAANGAIIITTKKGRPGRLKVDLDLQSGWGKLPRKVDVLNSPQYVEMRKEAFINDNLPMSDNVAYDIKNLYGWDTTRTIDWQDVLMGKTANYNNIKATVSGGNSQTQFLAGLGYNRETSITPGDFAHEQGSFHFNLNSSSNNRKFKTSLLATYVYDNNRLQAADFGTIVLTTPPTAPNLYNPDGSLNWGTNSAGTSTRANPLIYLLRTYRNRTDNFIVNSDFSYQIVQGLALKLSAGFNTINSQELLLEPLETIAPESRPVTERRSTFGNNVLRSWSLEPQITYDKRLWKGDLSVLVGSSVQQREASGTKFFAAGFISDALMEDVNSARVLTKAPSASYQYKYNAVFGRINYNLDRRYIINLTARRDGTSRFGPENRFSNFGAIGLGWIFSEERFINLNNSILSFGKLKASYGSTGNDQVGDYTYYDLIQSLSTSIAYQTIPGLTANQLFNPYLQWERTKRLNVGLELGLWKDKFTLLVNYSKNRSGNLLVDYNLPITTGFGSIKTNLNATIENTSWEFALNSINIQTKKFAWVTSANFTLPKNKVVSFPDIAKSSYANSQPPFVGSAVTDFYVYKYAGVDPLNGLYMVEDANGNPTLSPGQLRDSKVKMNTASRYYGGVENSFSYGDFSLSFLIQFVRRDISNYWGGNPAGMLGINQPAFVMERWRQPGDAGPVKKFTTSASADFLPGGASLFKASDESYIKGYTKLRNISISWNLPAKWIKKAGMEQAKLFSNMQNVLTLSKYNGFDPETGIATPPLRLIVAGIHITF